MEEKIMLGKVKKGIALADKYFKNTSSPSMKNKPKDKKYRNYKKKIKSKAQKEYEKKLYGQKMEGGAPRDFYAID